MTADEERWIEIILEEGRKAEEADPHVSSGDARSSQRDRPADSRRNGQPFNVRAEHFIQRPGHHRATVI